MTDHNRFRLHDAHLATQGAAGTELWIDARQWPIPDKRIWYRAATGTGTAFRPLIGEAFGRIYGCCGETRGWDVCGIILVIAVGLNRCGPHQRAGGAGRDARPVRTQVARLVQEIHGRRGDDLQSAFRWQWKEHVMGASFDAITAARAFDEEIKFIQGIGWPNPMAGVFVCPVLDLLDGHVHRPAKAPFE